MCFGHTEREGKETEVEIKIMNIGMCLVEEDCVGVKERVKKKLGKRREGSNLFYWNGE